MIENIVERESAIDLNDESRYREALDTNYLYNLFYFIGFPCLMLFGMVFALIAKGSIFSQTGLIAFVILILLLWPLKVFFNRLSKIKYDREEKRQIVTDGIFRSRNRHRVDGSISGPARGAKTIIRFKDESEKEFFTGGSWIDDFFSRGIVEEGDSIRFYATKNANVLFKVERIASQEEKEKIQQHRGQLNDLNYPNVEMS